jgi:nucleotide-binding universal stress UspA family protein
MKKQKIVVLSGLKKGATSTLKSGIRLAKMMDGEVHFFCVKKPLDIIEKDSQLSAMRTINETHKLTSKKIKKMVAAAAANYGVKVNYSYTFGNVQNEIEDYIHLQKPDVIVLGKGKSSLFHTRNKKMIRFILEKFNGQILISDEKNPLEPNKDFSFGTLDNSINASSKKMTDLLIQDSKQPHTSFRINDSLQIEEKEAISTDKRTIEYIFEKGDNAIKNIAKYVAKSNINLVSLKREKNKVGSSNLKELINELNCSLIVTN